MHLQQRKRSCIRNLICDQPTIQAAHFLISPLPNNLPVVMTLPVADDALFLGLDCSTQSMSAVVVDARGHVVYEVLSVRRALSSVSGSAQQHASVYWSKGFSLRVCLDAAAESGTASMVEAMQKQQESAFCLPNGPSWMDSSTTRYCTELEAAVGGPDRVAEISGSRAYERFTGNQIAKRIHEDPAFLEKCGRIALVSSMLTSLLCGDYAPIDDSDGSGMNLLDVRKRVWSPELVKATTKYSTSTNATEKLVAALGSQVSRAYSSVSAIHTYFQKNYGFAADCKVIAFSGDNPCTLAGIGLSQPGDVGVSLGTSSTLFAVVPKEVARFSGKEGHFFCNPIDPNSVMAMICFKNGSLTRQDVRDRRASASWEKYEELMQITKTGNGGNTAFYYQDPEITPSTLKAGVVSFDASGARINMSLSPPEVEVRAVVESQFLSLRLHAEKLGVNKPQRLIVVGGASANKCMLQVLANVFNAPVYRLTCASNSAALGGAFRARHGFACAGSASGYVPFDVSDSLDFSLSATPVDEDAKTYSNEIPRFESLENQACTCIGDQSNHVAPPGQISRTGIRLPYSPTTSRPFGGHYLKHCNVEASAALVISRLALKCALTITLSMSSSLLRARHLGHRLAATRRGFHAGIVTAFPEIPFKLADIGEGIAEVEVLQWFVKSGDRSSSSRMCARCRATRPPWRSPVATTESSLRCTTRWERWPRQRQEERSSDPSQDAHARCHGASGCPAPEAPFPTPIAAPTPVVSRVPILLADLKQREAADVAIVDGSNATYLQQDTVVPLTPIQKMMVKSMNAALKIPHFGYADEIRMDALYELRKELKPLAELRGVKLSFMPFIIKAASLALKHYPMLNATVNESESELTLVAAHNISVAMDTPTGLIVPNVKNVQAKSIIEIAEDLNRLQQLAVAGKLAPSDLTGGSFSFALIRISNIGSIGGTYMSPVLMVPQVAIGAIGQIQKLPRYDEEGNVEPVRLMKVSWSGDHRVIDGATMARFSNQWKAYLETPVSMLTEMS
ncbi:Chloramphenicol acetyltransferase-like domain [Phytophthora cactorum]|nr:Chloramphenicol acetyltransferase-like domain [Phytophthora cactorum]